MLSRELAGCQAAEHRQLSRETVGFKLALKGLASMLFN